MNYYYYVLVPFTVGVIPARSRCLPPTIAEAIGCYRVLTTFRMIVLIHAGHTRSLLIYS